MICKQCGTSNEATDKFCFKCGSPLISDEPGKTIPVVKPESKKVVSYTKPNIDQFKSNMKNIYGKHQKKIIGGAVLFLVVFVLVPALVGIFSTGGFQFAENSVRVQYNSENNQSFVMSDEKIFELDEDGIFVKQNYLGNVAAYLSNYGDTGRDLTVIYKGKSLEIDDEVTGFEISHDGDKIAYVKSTKSNRVGDLYVYDISGKKSKKIDEDVYSKYFTLSPNGKTIMYLGDADADESEEIECTAYLSVNGGKPKEIRDNFIPISISDKGKIQYGFEFDDRLSEDGELVVYKGKKSTDLNVDFEELTLVQFNDDKSEILYSDNEKTYVSENAKEPIKIVNNASCTLVIPPNIKYAYTSGYSFRYRTYGIDSFKDKVVESLGFQYIDRKYETEKIASDVLDAFISKNGKELLVLDGKGNLERVDINKGKSKAREIADDVSSFYVSSDLEYVYYLDDNSDLFYIKGNSKPKEIESDVEKFYVFDHNKACFIKDSDEDGGTLYISSSGSKPKEIKDANDEAYRLYKNNDDIYVSLKQDENSMDFYALSGSGKLKKIGNDLDL